MSSDNDFDESVFYISLKDNLENFFNLWPDNLIDPLNDDILEKIWLSPMMLSLNPNPVLQAKVLLTGGVELTFPWMENVGITFGEVNNDENTEFKLELELEPTLTGRILDVPISIKIPATVLKPVREVENSDGISKYQVDEDAIHLTIGIGNAKCSLDISGNSIINADNGITLPLCMIGDTGFVISAHNISLSFTGDKKGLAFDSADIYFPPDLPAAPGQLKITDCFIGKNGFSGKIHGEWNLEYNENGKSFIGKVTGELFGFVGGLKKFAVEFQDNIPISTDIQGMMILPFFDEPVDIEIALSQSGNFSVIVKGVGPDGGLELFKEDLFKLKVQSLALDRNKEKNEISVEVSGLLQPLFYSREGVTWPEVSVEGLKVGYRNGDLFVDIKGGWIDFKDQAVLDLYGFKAELNKIGFGKEGEKLWIGATGSMRLVELLPIGASVKGLRVLWNPNLPIEQIPGSLEFDLKGIEIEHTIPQTMEFKGSAYFLNEGTIKGFGGDLFLNLPTAGFSAEAGLKVGINEENPPYPFFYIYLGVELPVGIPLGQSGLALKGAKGLFGYNVFPKIAAGENWYYDWYKRGPEVGVTHSTKWSHRRDALAFGAGVTITTTDGYIKGIKALLAFMLPGPVIIIEGRALFLAGLQPDAEPPLRMLAILDGNAGTIQLNVEAQAELIEGILDAYGGLEAFFNFNDITLWHIYLGQDQPEDRRIQGNILNLLKAKAYLMLDNDKMQMGAFVGIKKKYEYTLCEILDTTIALKIAFNAWIEGGAVLGWRPEQVEGKLAMEAGIKVSIPAITLHLGATAGVHVRGSNPFVVDASVGVKADLPDPFPDFETDFKFHWESPKPPPIDAPVSEISIGNDLESTGYSLKSHEKKEDVKFVISSPNNDDKKDGYIACAEKSPVVPLDARPLISFTHPVNDITECFFRDSQGVQLSYDIGEFALEPTITGIKIYEHKKQDAWSEDPDTDWTLVYETKRRGDNETGGNTERLNGVWLADYEPANPEIPGASRLRLWTKSPFVVEAHTSVPRQQGMQADREIYYGDRLLTDLYLAEEEETVSNHSGVSQTNYTQGFLNDYPDFGIPKIDVAALHCVDFSGIPAGEKPEGSEKAGFVFTGRDLLLKEIPREQRPLPITSSAGAIVSPYPGPRLASKPGKVPGVDDPAIFKGNVINLVRSGNTEELLEYIDKVELFSPIPVLSFRELCIELPTPASEITLLFYGNCKPSSTGVTLQRDKTPGEYSNEMTDWMQESITLQERLENVENQLKDLTEGENGGKTDNDREKEKDALEKQLKGIRDRIRNNYSRRPDYSKRVEVNVAGLTSEVGAATTTMSIIPEDGQAVRQLKLKSTCFLLKVCYIDAAEKEREDAQGELLSATRYGSIPRDEIILKPGSYYRIVVKSAVKVSGPFNIPDFFGPIYDTIWSKIKQMTDFTQEAFFQTGGPPTNLERCVLWSTPGNGENPVFCGYGFGIRFKRSYIFKMFENDEYGLSFGIYDTNGRVHANGFLSSPGNFRKISPPFLFSYEQLWKEYALNSGIIDVNNDAFDVEDDLLYIPLLKPLNPLTLYELKIFGGQGGPELLKEDFMQPGFADREKKHPVKDHGMTDSPGFWKVEEDENGILKQTSNINNRDGDSSAYGTVMLFGCDNWRDYQLAVDIKTGIGEEEEENAIGVVFYYREVDGKESYYRFSMRMHPRDKFKHYRKLVRIYKGSEAETVIGLENVTGRKIKAEQKIRTESHPWKTNVLSPYEKRFMELYSAEKKRSAPGGDKTMMIPDSRIKGIFRETFAEPAETEGILMEEGWQPYEYDKWYRIGIEVKNIENIDPQTGQKIRGVHIKVFLDSELVFDLIDPVTEPLTPESLPRAPISGGKPGLYCWGNRSASFKNMKVRDAALLRRNFITSRFDSFKNLIESGESVESVDSSRNKAFSGTINVNKNHGTVDITAVGNQAGQRYKLQRIQNEYDRKPADKEILEAAKRKLDEVNLALDDEFSKLIRGMTDNIQSAPGEIKLSQLIFEPLPEIFKIYRLVDKNDPAITVGFFMRSPEPIDWQEIISVEEYEQRVEKFVGRVTLSVSTAADETRTGRTFEDAIGTGGRKIPTTINAVSKTNESSTIRSLFRKAPLSTNTGETQQNRDEGLLIYNADKTQAVYLLQNKVPGDKKYTLTFELHTSVDCPENNLLSDADAIDSSIENHGESSTIMLC